MIQTLEMKPHLADPLTALAFSKRGRQLGLKRRRDGGLFFFREFYGTRLQIFAFALAAGRLRIKLYMKYLSPLYQSPFNE